MKLFSASSTRILFLLGVASLAFSGCATSPASVKSQPGAIAAAELRKYDFLTVKVSAADGVALVSYEADRIRERIVEAVKTKPVGAFKGFNPGEPQASALLMDVRVTRYDKGNAFARAMLIGLGQIHVDAEVTVRAADTQAQVARFTVKKRFAWGGLYGATVSVEDVERGFASGIAAGLAGEK